MLRKWERGSFLLGEKRNRVDVFCWGVINVYGPMKKELKSSFLQELCQKIQGCFGPVMGGGL
jgi:hypothetical protein